MIHSRIRSMTRLFAAAMALGVVTLGVATAPAGAAGLRNCVDVTGPQIGRAGCYEDVWAGGTEYRMTFANQGFKGATPNALDAFYVVGPQTGRPQGAPPNTFPHDHVVRDVPAQNHGAYSVQLQGIFVLCSGQGIGTGSCVPAWASLGGPDPLPFATTVNGRPLTSASAIEAASAAGHVALIDLGPGAVIVGTLAISH